MLGEFDTGIDGQRTTPQNQRIEACRSSRTCMILCVLGVLTAPKSRTRHKQEPTPGV
jgi:hypothetical protein